MCRRLVIAFHRLDVSSHGWDVGILEPNPESYGLHLPSLVGAARVLWTHVIPAAAWGVHSIEPRTAFPPPLGHGRVLRQRRATGEEFMQTQTLAMDWILQPARWQPLRWVAEWLRDRTARQRERRQARRRRVAYLTANYFDGTGAASHVVRDVSTNGAFIFADFQWPPGTMVRMTLQVEGHPFPAATLVRAVVVRCAQHGIGVQFMPAKKTERRSLANFLKSI